MAKNYDKTFGLKASWIRSLPCAACKKHGPSDPAHMRSRGAGGTSKHLVPLCRMCHIDQHTRGIKTFFADYGYADPLELAEHYEQLWLDVDGWVEDEGDLAF